MPKRDEVMHATLSLWHQYRGFCPTKIKIVRASDHMVVIYHMRWRKLVEEPARELKPSSWKGIDNSLLQPRQPVIKPECGIIC